ncbi:MAG: hypothetical protein U0166_16050 [Acidobacteriota bacterium]
MRRISTIVTGFSILIALPCLQAAEPRQAELRFAGTITRVVTNTTDAKIVKGIAVKDDQGVMHAAPIDGATKVLDKDGKAIAATGLVMGAKVAVELFRQDDPNAKGSAAGRVVATVIQLK